MSQESSLSAFVQEEWRGDDVMTQLLKAMFSSITPSPSANPESGTPTTPNPSNGTGKPSWQWRSLLLCRHILTRGLEHGIGSDIVVKVPAWNKVYNLHRLVLDQNPYFHQLLQSDFCEASSDSVTLHFPDDGLITADAFYFMLCQLYGKHYDIYIGHDNVRQVLTTCSFFRLDYVCEYCVDFILRNLNEQCVVEYMVFADQNLVYGSEKICDAIFAYLCREAYRMDRTCVADLPMHWIKRVVDSDAFWVPSEYDRYQFFYQILYLRHASASVTYHLPESWTVVEDSEVADDTKSVLSMSDPLPKDIQRIGEDKKRSSFDRPWPGIHKSKSTSNLGSQITIPDMQNELSMMNDVLLNSIHYMHMTFEQLESIRINNNPFTLRPMVPENVLKDALWHQIQLRSKVERASERDLTLSLTVPQSEISQNGSHFYAIPTADTTTYTAESSMSWTDSTHSKEHQDDEKEGSRTHSDGVTEQQQYNIYPPFRFSVEFANVASLKHGMRVYSDTIFYAGSNWNMYIQKTRSQRRGMLQLGVYLHRQSVPLESCEHFGESNSNGAPCEGILREIRRTHVCPSKVPTLSRYADRRKVVKTWFKIFCPGRGPRHTLALFQSSPDKFSVLQSWGWKSTTLCAEESSGIGTNQSPTSPEAVGPSSGSNTTRYEQTTSGNLPEVDTRDTIYSTNAPISCTSLCDASISVPNLTASTSTSAVTTLRLSVVMGHV